MITPEPAESNPQLDQTGMGPMSAADLRAMAGRGLAALPSFMCQIPNAQFHRDSVAVRNADDQTSSQLYPTATAHGLLALLDTGAYSSRDVRRAAPLKQGGVFGASRPKWSRNTHGQIQIPRSSDAGFEFPYIHDFLERSIRTDADSGSFLKNLYGASSHVQKPMSRTARGTGPPDRSELILLGHVAPALVFGCDYVVRYYSDKVFDTHIQEIIERCFSGLKETIPAIQKVLGYNKRKPQTRDLDASHCWSHIGRMPDSPAASGGFDPGIPTYLLANASFAVRALFGLSGVIETVRAREPLKALADNLEELFGDREKEALAVMQDDLALATRRRLERLMANRGIPDETLFDPVGLTFATRAMCLLEPGFRRCPLFREAIVAIARCQLADGCWPDGAATNSRHGTATLQPSVEVAYALAAAVYTRSARRNPTAAEIVAMKIALPAVQRHARYLELTFLDNTRGRGGGWSNDRARNSANPELWTTALAVRFLHFAALIADAFNRTEVLIRYDPALVSRTDALDERATNESPEERFREIVVEPEPHTEPVEVLAKRFIGPIARKMDERRYITRPAKNGVSFLLFGPPRSGKTFLVTSLAEALRLPLLPLDPGNFVPRSGESVGAMMSRVFDDLRRLHDVVVLFDECDELLISRSGEYAGLGHMPLVTSSLLTRLSALRGRRGPIFCFATNYYHRVDSAARGVGRFDAVLMFDRPHGDARRTIIGKVWKDVYQNHNSALGEVGIEELPTELVDRLVTDLSGCAYLEIQSAVVELGLLLFGDKGCLVDVPLTDQIGELDTLLANDIILDDGIKEVIHRNSPSREDYFRWCKGDGLHDLRACDGGSFSFENKVKVVNSWQRAAQALKLEFPSGTAESILGRKG